MLVPYTCCTKKFEDYYAGQTGHGMPFYQGTTIQRGYGIGGFFAKLFRSAMPFLVSGAKTVGKEALRAGTQVASDVLSGQNFKTSLQTRAKESGKVLARKAVQKADEMIGRGLYKRKRKTPKHSPECAKSELELFTLPPTQTVIERRQWVEFHPLANVSDGSPVEFNVSGSGDEYLDLSQTQLYVKVKILKSDGKPLTAEDKVGPVNLLLHSLWSQVDISLNERLISSSNNTYPYRAMLETLLNHGYDTKTSQLSSELFFKDTAGLMNVFDTKATPSNDGFNK
ncbi:hypothetical protein RF55_22253 [Lasius niger]|uniref:Uncharacterized protein n=1 Tax=Lasius niger TaxID=67767 RepID=A0A0J7JX54_LASNI|nr:hypothetical protein RF55_22253 [Lasius niger]